MKNLPLHKISLATLCAGIMLLAGGGTALAAYSPGSYPGLAPAGAFPAVVTTQTFGVGGGSLQTNVGGYALTLKVPSGAFSTSTQVTVYSSNAGTLNGLLPSNESFLDAFAIGWTPTSTASKPLLLTVTNANINASTLVYFTTASGLTLDSGATVSNGVASLSFTGDPGVVLANSTATPTSVGHLGGGAGTTGPNTGEVFMLAGLLLLLMGGGLMSSVVLRRQRHTAS